MVVTCSYAATISYHQACLLLELWQRSFHCGSGLPSKRFDFAISIVSRWTDNYYHFLIESIPRMVIMLQEESIMYRQIVEFGLADKTHAGTVKIPIIVRSGPAYIHELMTLILREHESSSVTVSHSFDYAIEDLTEQDVFSVKRLFTVDWHGDQNMFNLETAGSRYALQKSQLYFSQLSLPKSKTPSSTTGGGEQPHYFCLKIPVPVRRQVWYRTLQWGW